MTTSELVAGHLTREVALASRPGDIWLSKRSWNRRGWTIGQLEEAKAGRTISVVLPALNEEETVESVIDSISPLVDALVDELIVLDSGSTDDTEIRAIAAGARVVSREQAFAGVPTRPGKGEALWRSLAATSGDIVVFVDSDLINSPTRCSCPWLVGPCCSAEGIHPGQELLPAPAQCRRRGVAARAPPVAGRVTELVARPCWRRCGRSWAVCCSRSRRVRGYPGTAHFAAVRPGLWRGDRPCWVDTFDRLGPGRDRPGQSGRAGLTATGRWPSWAQ